MQVLCHVIILAPSIINCMQYFFGPNISVAILGLTTICDIVSMVLLICFFLPGKYNNLF